MAKAKQVVAVPIVKAPKAKAPAVKAAAVETNGVKLSIKLDSSAAIVDKLIVSIKNRGAKLDVDMHSAACASLNHVALHNDPTLLNRFINAMPKSGRRNSVLVWALRYGNVLLNEDKQSKESMPLVYNKAGKANIAGAVAEPFWMLKNVKEGGTEWLYMDYIGSVMKKLALVAHDPKNPEHAKAKAALDALSAVNEALNTTSAPTNPTSAAVVAGDGVAVH